MVSPLSWTYNAQGFTLTWGAGKKQLATGISSFKFYLTPMSQSLSRTAFGAQSTWQVHADYTDQIKGGDFLFVNSWGGRSLNPPMRLRIDGVQPWPHALLPHVLLALSEHRQS